MKREDLGETCGVGGGRNQTVVLHNPAPWGRTSAALLLQSILAILAPFPPVFPMILPFLSKQTLDSEGRSGRFQQNPPTLLGA